jgi:glycosyltransferase involved in cell wall biosynthesis
VDNEFFAKRSEDAVNTGRVAQIRTKLGIPTDAFVALFVGKLIKRKRPQVFVEAITKAISSRPIHGIIVGSGSMESECRQLAKSCLSRIHFIGFQNQTKLPAYYRSADVIVLLSDETETWGLVVNEAMACGTPAIVSTACGCAPDLIVEGRTGYAYDGNNVAELTQRLAQLQLDLTIRPRKIQQAIAKKVEQYSMQTATDGLLQAIESVTRV